MLPSLHIQTHVDRCSELLLAAAEPAATAGPAAVRGEQPHHFTIAVLPEVDGERVSSAAHLRVAGTCTVDRVRPPADGDLSRQSHGFRAGAGDGECELAAAPDFVARHGDVFPVAGDDQGSIQWESLMVASKGDFQVYSAFRLFSGVSASSSEGRSGCSFTSCATSTAASNRCMTR